MTESTDLGEFLAEVERVRASGALGRSNQLLRLFEFLVQCRGTGRVPKEVEIAVDCFERSATADAPQDATVRVTAHKLRRRLEEFYANAGAGPRLTIPRGEYRLMLAVPGAGAGPAADDTGAAARRWHARLPGTRREQVAWSVAALAIVAAALSWLLVDRQPRVPASLVALQAAPLWASVLEDELPIQFVLGDYYIFGERDERGEVRRLVRDFAINSGGELEHRLQANPALAARYAELNLGYLPTSSAQALRAVLPVVMAAGKPVMLTLSSELDPASLKNTHVIYVGYLSALGMLEELVLGISRYSTGGSYDQLVDSISGEVRVSEGGQFHPPGASFRDYAYLASFKGAGDHAHLVIAGTRDVGLMQAAELAADGARLREMAAGLPRGGQFEALYEVQGLNGINVAARLLEASPLDAPPLGLNP
jgi:hypothetical protein